MITGLIALVAVLGTAAFFLQSNQNIISTPEARQDEQGALSQAETQSRPNVSVVMEIEESSSQPSSIPPNAMTVEEECEAYGIPPSECSENNLLAKKRLAISQQQQSESIKISNAQIWVANNNTSTTAFVIHNTGSESITVESISLRGLSVPVSDWFFTTAAPTPDTFAKLPADYTEPSITIDGTSYATVSGIISLAQGQSAIVYLNEAGSMDAIDSGNNYTLQIQAGQETAMASASAVSVN